MKLNTQNPVGSVGNAQFPKQSAFQIASYRALFLEHSKIKVEETPEQFAGRLEMSKMSEMVDRVAKRLCNGLDETWDELPDYLREGLRRDARDIIAAIVDEVLK